MRAFAAALVDINVLRNSHFDSRFKVFERHLCVARRVACAGRDRENKSVLDEVCLRDDVGVV